MTGRASLTTGRLECNIKITVTQHTEGWRDKIAAPTQTIMGSNQGLLNEKLVSNSLSYDFVMLLFSPHNVMCVVRQRRDKHLLA
jgi:hypothetical protein